MNVKSTVLLTSQMKDHFELRLAKEFGRNDKRLEEQIDSLRSEVGSKRRVKCSTNAPFLNIRINLLPQRIFVQIFDIFPYFVIYVYISIFHPYHIFLCITYVHIFHPYKVPRKRQWAKRTLGHPGGQKDKAAILLKVAF